MVVPGFTRTAGYYGRYARASGVGTELKFFDGANSTASVSATGAILEDSLNEIAQGAGESNRVGRKCTLKSIHLRGEFTLPAQTSATTSSERVRFIVYLDKQCNGATAAVTDILESGNQDSFLNLANKSRFRILGERTCALNAHGATATAGAYTFGEVVKNFKMNLKCNLPLEFDGATGAITELRSNNIRVLAISDSAVATCVFRWRVRYADN